MVFDIAMAILFWVELWRIGRQFFHYDFRMFSQIGACFLAEMDTGPIPDQNHLARNVSLEMLERFNNLLAFDGPFEMAFVNLARQGQRHGGRQSPPITGDPSEHGPFAFASPGRR